MTQKWGGANMSFREKLFERIAYLFAPIYFLLRILRNSCANEQDAWEEEAR